MHVTEKMRAYARLAPRARRNRLDLGKQIVRRPGIAIGLGTYEVGLFASARLDNRTKTLASLKTASMIGCHFCTDLGSSLAPALGIGEAELSALPSYRDSSLFAPREKLAIELAEAMSRTPAIVDNDIRASVVAAFTPAELVELVAEIAWENHRSRLNLGLGVRAMGFSDGTFCVRPEHTS
jgi:alkylhydroperoxidase family enzyme